MSASSARLVVRGTCVLALVGCCAAGPQPGAHGAADSSTGSVVITAIGAGRGDNPGAGHTCALDSAGGVWCWGENIFGELGDGTTDDRAMPVHVTGLQEPAKAIAVGGHHTCVLTGGGGVKCWGVNVRGQLGDGSGSENSAVPVDVSGLQSGVSAIATGAGHVCALADAGAVRCWGMFGGGATDDVMLPVAIQGLSSGVRALAGGTSHTCVITAAGGVRCWGSGDWGQLGDAKTLTQAIPIRDRPVDVVGLSGGVKAIAAGDAHTCALTDAGAVECWGANLANSTRDNAGAPVAVAGLGSGVASIATSYWHTCAVMGGGTVRCWGNNDYGQLGDGTRSERFAPVQVGRLSARITAVAAGGYHTCALTSVGGVLCWGSNATGQLGDGTTTDRSRPVEVRFP